MKRAVTAAAAVALMLTSCAPADPPIQSSATATDAGLLVDFGLDGMDTAGIIDHLDRLDTAQRPTDLMASVRQDELLLSDGAQELTLDLPEDRSYLSIAPYLSQTHECFFHSLTTCLGELGNKSISVKITDGATGETLVEEQTETFSNGFAGYWIPDNVQGTIEISYAGHSSSTDFSTSDDGATCITDLRLT
ncbi:CueP family metal-binding protein [Arthrobacter sp. NPDC089319]|uniref:CueP family metal-binding protein n=1 Tax=Arthrobacter sp. NPDC089319 TaxID=3155915 RepID=UPI0034221A4B